MTGKIGTLVRKGELGRGERLEMKDNEFSLEMLNLKCHQQCELPIQSPEQADLL